MECNRSAQYYYGAGKCLNHPTFQSTANRRTRVVELPEVNERILHYKSRKYRIRRQIVRCNIRYTLFDKILKKSDRELVAA